MSNESGIYVVGIGDNSAVYIDLAEVLNIPIAGLVDYNSDRVGENFLDYRINSCTKELLSVKNSLAGYNFALSMGDNSIRAELAKKIREKGGCTPTLIHPTASVSRHAHIEEGVVIHANVTIQANCTVKKDSVISSGTVLIHGATIGNGCYIAANATVGADVIVEDQVFIGLGAVIVSKKVSSIARESLIGAGAIVVRSVDERSVMIGNPAKNLTK